MVNDKMAGGGGGIHVSSPSSPRLNSQHSLKFSEEKIVYVANVNQQRCFDESGMWLENVDQTLLAPASGKLVLQKRLNKYNNSN